MQDYSVCCSSLDIYLGDGSIRYYHMRHRTKTALQHANRLMRPLSFYFILLQPYSPLFLVARTYIRLDQGTSDKFGSAQFRFGDASSTHLFWINSDGSSDGTFRIVHVAMQDGRQPASVREMSANVISLPDIILSVSRNDICRTNYGRLHGGVFPLPQGCIILSKYSSFSGSRRDLAGGRSQ